MLFLGIGSLAFFTAGPEEIFIPRVSGDPVTVIEPNIEISRQSDRLLPLTGVLELGLIHTI